MYAFDSESKNDNGSLKELEKGNITTTEMKPLLGSPSNGDPLSLTDQNSSKALATESAQGKFNK